jgi:hypothetical protein
LLASLSLLGAAKLTAAAPKACILSNNQAADERASRHLLAAREHYLACAGAADCPSVVRDECSAALAELKSATPTLSVSVVDDAQRDVSDAQLSIDGQSRPLDGSLIELDPGSHLLRAERQGLHVELEVMASEGELNRRVQLVLTAPKSAQPATAPLAAPPAATAGPSRVPSYVLAGVGGLAAASFGYFAISGASRKSELEACKPYCQRSDVSDVRTRYLLADISLGVSLVALGSAAYLWLRAKPEAPSQPAPLSLDLSLSSERALVGVRWATE